MVWEKELATATLLAYLDDHYSPYTNPHKWAPPLAHLVSSSSMQVGFSDLLVVLTTVRALQVLRMHPPLFLLMRTVEQDVDFKAAAEQTSRSRATS